MLKVIPLQYPALEQFQNTQIYFAWLCSDTPDRLRYNIVNSLFLALMKARLNRSHILNAMKITI